LCEQHPHERDTRLTFDALLHRYWIDGETRLVTSVTAFAKRRVFHQEVVARRLARLQRCTKEYLLQKWTGATDLGVELHGAIDDHLNGRVTQTQNVATEFAFFLAWRQQHTDWKAWRTEWRVFSKRLRLAGTLDALFQLSDGSWVLIDWKRVDKVTSDKKDEWTRQLNLYRYLLVKYGIIVSRLLVVVLHPSNEGFVEYDIAIDDAMTAALVQARREQLQAAVEAHDRAAVAKQQAEDVLAAEMATMAGGATSSSGSETNRTSRGGSRMTTSSSTSGTSTSTSTSTSSGSSGGSSSANSSRPTASTTGATPTVLSGKSVAFVGHKFSGTSRAELEHLAGAAGVKVKGRRAKVDVVVQGQHHAGSSAGASATARGASCLSAPSFVRAATAAAVAQRAGDDAATAQAAAEGAGAAPSAAAPTATTTATAAAAARTAPGGATEGQTRSRPSCRQSRAPQPPVPPIEPGIFVCGNRGPWSRPITFMEAAAADAAVEQEARRLGAWLRKCAAGCDKLALHCAVYMVRYCCCCCCCFCCCSTSKYY
jgi:hypothetical protein